MSLNVDQVLDAAGLTNEHVRDYVKQWAAITQPDHVEVVSAADDARLIAESLEAGELLPAGEGLYYSRSYFKDTARAEERTIVATADEADKGVYNNWRHSSRRASGTGSGSGPPNTASELANTNFGGAASLRQRSSSARVASRLTRIPMSKSASACPLTTAARWKTVSVSGVTAAAITAGSARSPVTADARGSAGAWPATTSSRTIEAMARCRPRASVSVPREQNAWQSHPPFHGPALPRPIAGGRL